MSNNVPMLIKRCLVHQIQILPFEFDGIMKQYELKKISDVALAEMKEEDLKKYVRGLSLCSREMAEDWTRGHELLKELGFVENIREAGHRRYVSLVWEDK